MALDQILIKYGLELDEVKRELADLKKSLGGVDEQAKVSAAKTETALNSVATNVKGNLTKAFVGLGSVIAATFAIQRIGNFINSSIELATRTQEIRFEFEKLNKPGLLANLKKATAGTLSDLKLMEVALRADKLGVPMEKLGKIMEFAKLRADALGKSTEELTDTLVQGIGIKGTRALVQVGISQEEFSAEVKKTGDYFLALDNIMTKALDNAGEGFESVADKQDKLRANIENTKVAIGEKLLPVIDDLLVGLNKAATAMQILFDPDAAARARINEIIGKKTLEQLENQLKVNERELLSIKAGNEEIEKAIELGVGKYNADINRYKALKLQNEEIAKAISFQKDENKEVKLGLPITEESTKATVEKTKEVSALALAYQALGRAIGESMEPLIDQLELLPEIPIEPVGVNVDKLSDAMLSADGNAVQLKPALQGVNDVLEDTPKSLDESIEAWSQYGDAVFEVLRGITDYFQQQSDYRLDILNNELEAGKISQGQYDKDAAELRRKEAIRTKALALFDVVINTPAAIMKAFAQLGPAGAVLATLAGVLQLGAIVNTPIPKFAKGVIGFKGKGTDTSDENLVAISNQESIITAKGTRKHKGLLEAVNKDKVDEYFASFYLSKAFDKKASRANDDQDYREFLELKRLGLINRNGFAEVVKALKDNKPHRY
jgi:hypothetical protein